MNKTNLETTPSKLKFEKMTSKNYKIAVKIQNTIFPLENGSDDLEEAISKKKDKYFETLEYYLVKNENYYVGITGIYSHKEYPDDAWIGWFGIIPAFRKKGYGAETLEFTKKKAKSMGFKSLRLYTDDKYNFVSTLLFEKFGMFKEIYEEEKGKYYQIGNMIIYSLSLDDSELEPWNNKNIFLEDHEIKNNALQLEYVEINETNVDIAANIQYNLFYSCNNVGYLDYLKEIMTKDRLKNRILPIDFLIYF